MPLIQEAAPFPFGKASESGSDFKTNAEIFDWETM